MKTSTSTNLSKRTPLKLNTNKKQCEKFKECTHDAKGPWKRVKILAPNKEHHTDTYSLTNTEHLKEYLANIDRQL